MSEKSPQELLASLIETRAETMEKVYELDRLIKLASMAVACEIKARKKREKREAQKKKNIELMLGRRFGKLVVEQFCGGTSTSSFRYMCICDCGKQKAIEARSLLRGMTKSCGCLHKLISSSAIRRSNALKVTGWGALNKSKKPQ